MLTHKKDDISGPVEPDEFEPLELSEEDEEDDENDEESEEDEYLEEELRPLTDDNHEELGPYNGCSDSDSQARQVAYR